MEKEGIFATRPSNLVIQDGLRVSDETVKKAEADESPHHVKTKKMRKLEHDDSNVPPSLVRLTETHWAAGCVLYMMLGGCFPFRETEEQSLEEAITSANFRRG